MLTFNDYQKATAETAIYKKSIKDYLEAFNYGCLIGDQITPYVIDEVAKVLSLQYCSLGLGEVGELQGKIKKVIRDSGGQITDETRKALTKELGDVLWYVSQTCSELGIDMGEVAQGNLDKLMSRKERGVLKGSGDDR